YTLNVTRSSMVAAGWSPSVRLFEAAACATAIISDRWTGLDSFFPTATINTAGQAEEVIDILSRQSDRVRLAMAKRARATILASHTGAARAREFVSLLARPRSARPALDLDIESAA
ncbi:MAG: glycosyltransferase family 1 protein, partial [Mesorhizobium sp.]